MSMRPPRFLPRLCLIMLAFSVIHLNFLFIFKGPHALGGGEPGKYCCSVKILPPDALAQGEDIESKEMPAHLKAKINTKALGVMAEEAHKKRVAAEEIWNSSVPSKVIAHFKGRQGKPLVYKTPPVSELLPNQLIPDMPGVEDFKERFKSGELFNDSIIPNCESSKSQIKKIDTSQGKIGEEKVYIDNVYLEKDFLVDNGLPQDVKDLFGSDVSVTIYDRGTTSAINAIIKASGITCLPYRVRLTSGSNMKLSGRDALRNFDLGKAKGGYHPRVAEVLRRMR